MSDTSSMDTVGDGSIGIPAISPRFNTTSGEDLSRWSIKYFKADMNEAGDLLELQLLETRAERGDGVKIKSKKTFTFNERFFIVICYLERNL